MNSNITWHDNKITHDDRRRVFGQKPMVLWFTGLSGSGKSTVAAEVEKLLTAAGYKAYLLDGDNIRHGLNNNLGFSEDDRSENIRRLYETAKLMADSGLIVLVGAISPMRKMRDDARKCIQETCDFAEIFINADVNACAERDPKGLYKRALAGELKDFTGVSAPYEIPESPEIILDTVNKTLDYNANIVYNYISDNQIDYKALLDVIIPTSIKAGDAIMRVYENEFDVEYKDDASPLTEADKQSNAVICEALTKHFPYYSILAEESADNKSRLRERYCFIVDPLDGTKEFIKRNGEFTVNIALSFDGKSILGVIYVPCTRTLYYAWQGGGAYKSVDGDSPEKIHVSDRTSDLIIMNSRSHGDDGRLEKLLEANKDKIADTVSSGSSIKGCLIAEGKADIYYRFGYTMEWDTAAMQCICEEAGAIFTQCDDSPLTYNRRNSLNEKGFCILNDIKNKFHN